MVRAKAWLQCEQFNFDDGDCDEEMANNAAMECLPGNTRDCIQNCMPTQLLGDDDCDYRFNCAAFNYDEGDCPEITWPNGTGGNSGGSGDDGCDNDQVQSCNSTACFPASWIDDGYCDTSLNCPDTDYDGGDCTDTSDGCAAGQVEDCNGGCKPANWVDDSYCDSSLDCAETDFDGGDCSTPTGGCGDDRVKGCDGSCVPASWVGDDECDAVLRCYQTGLDGGDCDALTCGDDAVIDCAQSQCVPTWWVGDGFCDYALNCSATNHDGGDCG